MHSCVRGVGIPSKLLAHYLIQAAWRGEPDNVVVLLRRLVVQIKRTIQARIGEITGMFVLHVIHQFDCGPTGSHRANSRNVKRLEQKAAEFPILQILIIEVEPQGRA